MSVRLSKRRLLEHLKELWESPKIKVRKGKLRREHGTAHYERTPGTNELVDIRIILDPRNSPTVTYAIHELLHVYLAQKHQIDLLFTEPLEEAVVAGLTNELEMYLHNPKNERLFQSWIKAVEFKLK